MIYLKDLSEVLLMFFFFENIEDNYPGDKNLPLQVTKDGNIIHDNDVKISPSMLLYSIDRLFGKDRIQSGKEFFNDEKYNKEIIIDGKIALLVKNCTWLNYDRGNDDYRVTKRRIQLSSYYHEYTQHNISNGLTTYYVGVYPYGKLDDYLYVVYETDEYIKNKPNNSAAHVSIYDLYEARVEGSFFKIDNKNNKVHVFDKEHFISFINEGKNSQVSVEADYQTKLIEYFTSFWKSLPKKWNGVEAYQKLCSVDYKNQFQTRWEGFIYEYCFEEYLQQNPTNLIEWYGDKSDNGIDLDLLFPGEQHFYGDLKNDNTDDDIWGNDKTTIDYVIKQNGHIWYVCSRFKKVIYDKDMNYIVKNKYIELKELYNETHKDKKPIKYDKYNDLKYSYEVDRYFIIDIRPSNINLLGVLAQGRNSDGKPREPKYKVLKKRFEDFIKFEYIA